MEFQDSWLDDDSEVLTRVCVVLVPGGAQSDSSGYGLGGIVDETGITRMTLSCMEVPESLVTNFERGVRVVLERDLIVDDPAGYIESQRVIEYDGDRYQISRKTVSRQHNLKRIGLKTIGAA